MPFGKKEIRQRKLFKLSLSDTVPVCVSVNEGRGLGEGGWGGTATVCVLERGSGLVSEHWFTETKKMNKYDLPCTSIGFFLT